MSDGLRYSVCGASVTILPRISIVIPALNEAAGIAVLVERARLEADEVVVCDGGSLDNTVTLAKAAGAIVCQSEPGRGRQLDAGAAVASGEILWFLHADSALPPGAGAAVRWGASTGPWGCFGVRIESDDYRLRWCGRYMTLRARKNGSVTGDMGIWCRREMWSSTGGFGTRRVGEDLAFSRLLRQIEPGNVLPLRIGTSARRWDAEGVTRTMLRMWMVRGAFYAGVPDAVLVWLYRSAPR